MKKHLLRIAGLSLLAAVMAVAPTQALAQDKKEKPAGEKAQKPANPGDRGPFGGKLAAVDKTAKTITVGERTFQVTAETKIMKGGKPATLDDAVVGEPVGGYFTKNAEGKMVLKSVRFGAKPEGATQGEGKKKKTE